MAAPFPRDATAASLTVTAFACLAALLRYNIQSYLTIVDFPITIQKIEMVFCTMLI